MTDIYFESNLSWGSQEEKDEGELTANETSISISEPSEMGGKGKGMSPEHLLVSAVGSCYIGTLFKLLKKRRLPVEHVSVRAEGVVINYPKQMEFKRITVYPTVHFGDKSRQEEYEKWASKARDKCFIGQTIRNNVGYEVGPVQINAGNESEE